MGTVTFSGANGIDFNVILNAVMAQERIPLTTLQTQQSKLRTQSSALATLATRLGAVQSAAEALTSSTAFSGRSVSTTDDSVLTASGSSDAIPGIYDVVVKELARAQVTASSSRHADVDTTVVATGGTLTIGGVEVALSGDTTLRGLADAINGADDIGVAATVVKASDGYQLVLTGRTTGAASAFTITNALTGSTVAFLDTDEDGVSGDSAADNATQATDAELLVNNVTVTSATNTVEDVIPGTTLTLRRKQPSTPVTVSVTETSGSTKSLIEGFVTAYNALVTYAQQQSSATDGIGRDPLFRSLRGELRTTLTDNYDAGGSLTSLAQVGLEFDRTGKLTINSSLLQEALDSSPTSLRKLFMGDGTNTGAFAAVAGAIARYTDAGALLSAARTRLTDQISSLDKRLADMEERLATRRAALQKEYAATDMLISQLNSQAGSLSSLGSQYRLF